MSRPRVLDLCCCAGGAAVGYSRAGFDVFGVDIDAQPRYPFAFHRGDAIAVLDRLLAGERVEFTHHDGRVEVLGLTEFALVHGSPPCQRFSDLARRNGNAHEWPDLVTPMRDRLFPLGLPYIIENVEGAPLHDPIVLCGTMFPGLRVLRHRLFESNVVLTAPRHITPHPLVFTHDKRKAHHGLLDQSTAYVQVTGGGNATIANKRAAMGGLDWMSGREVNEAIPPAYTEHLGRQVLALVGDTAAATGGAT